MSKDVGGDAPRADLGNTYALTQSIDAQLAREHVHGRFGGVVERVATDEVVDAGNRTDVDDVPAIALQHSRHQQAYEMQYRLQIDGDLRIDLLRRCRGDRAGEIDAGAVGGQDIERHLCGQLRQRVEIAHVDGMRNATGPYGQLLQQIGAARERVNFQPLLQKRSTMAAPIPDDAPVTKAVL